MFCSKKNNNNNCITAYITDAVSMYLYIASPVHGIVIYKNTIVKKTSKVTFIILETSRDMKEIMHNKK
jgi:hypothetical protein